MNGFALEAFPEIVLHIKVGINAQLRVIEDEAYRQQMYWQTDSAGADSERDSGFGQTPMDYHIAADGTPEAEALHHPTDCVERPTVERPTAEAECPEKYVFINLSVSCSLVPT